MRAGDRPPPRRGRVRERRLQRRRGAVARPALRASAKSPKRCSTSSTTPPRSRRSADCTCVSTCTSACACTRSTSSARELRQQAPADARARPLPRGSRAALRAGAAPRRSSASTARCSMISARAVYFSRQSQFYLRAVVDMPWVGEARPALLHQCRAALQGPSWRCTPRWGEITSPRARPPALVDQSDPR